MIVIHSLGPFYTGVEYDPPDRRRVCRSWLVEDGPPWRKSIAAFRVRIREYGLHIGLCRHQRHEERPWHGRYVSIDEIRNWRGLSNAGEEAVGMEASDGEAIPPVDEVRSAD